MKQSNFLKVSDTKKTELICQSVASDFSGMNSRCVERIVYGSRFPMRKLEINGENCRNNDWYRKEVGDKIEALSKLNGSRKDFNAELKKACIDMLFSQFSKLCIDSDENELELAFQLCASQVITIDATIWYGEFNLVLFGKMLFAYVEFRNKVLYKYQCAVEVQQKELANEELEKRLLEAPKNLSHDWKNDFWELVKKVNAGLYVNCQDGFFPYYLKYFCDRLFKGDEAILKMPIKDSPLYTELLHKTRNYVRLELNNESIGGSTRDIQRNAKKELQNLDSGNKTAEYYLRCNGIYNRFVIEYYLRNPHEVNIKERERVFKFLD